MKNTFVMTIAMVLLAVAVPLGVLISAQVRNESSIKDEGGSGGSESGQAQPAQHPSMQAGDYRVSGPFTHKNLTISLTHGKNLIEGKTFLTLQERSSKRKSWFTRRKT